MLRKSVNESHILQPYELIYNGKKCALVFFSEIDIKQEVIEMDLLTSRHHIYAVYI